VAERGIAVGETVLLRRAGGEAHLLKVVAGPQSVRGLGVVDLSAVIGGPAGAEVSWGGTPFRVLRPTLPDLLAQLTRRAQIITPKDSAQLAYLAGIGPGQRVAEAGAGSGALTVTLAWAVGPEGRVYSFDRRADFLEVAKANVELAGLSERVEFREGDVAATGWGLDGLDAVLLDLPEPWSALAPASAALRPGGFVATYTPTYNQLERSVRALRGAGFEEVRSIELLERALHVGEGGTRPEFQMLGHTGFLSVGRKGG
jgi:tRNA (adenine57-N1/adenine58-N1)-methyltransferase catalytic subunit